VSQFAGISRHLRGCPGGVGLTTALSVLRSGWVIVGSLPTKNGSVSGSGCLIVLDQWGHVRETFAGQGINGPWDMSSLDLGSQAVLFVTNVLNGTVAAGGHTVYGGTVLRLVIQIPRHGLPWIQFNTTIGSGFPETLNAAALVQGPTGVGLGRNDILYVADTLTNRIAGIPDALFRGFSDGAGFTVSQGHHLNAELGLVVAPGGDILTVNGATGISWRPRLLALRSRSAGSTAPAPRRARVPSSAWSSSLVTTPSTSWTTPPTRWICCTNRFALDMSAVSGVRTPETADISGRQVPGR
jgi:hypothetical protein